MQTQLNVLSNIISRTNGKLDTIVELLNKNKIKISDDKLMISDAVEIQILYSNHGSISLGKFFRRGARTLSHVHENLSEYLICINGSAKVFYNEQETNLDYQDCIFIPSNTSHVVEALVDNTEIVAVCVPAEEGYKKR